MVPREKKELLVKLLNAPGKGFNPDFCKRQIEKLVTEYPDLKNLMVFW